MNVFKLLTYDIKEHNYIRYTSFLPIDNPEGFWQMIFREIKNGIGRRRIWYIIQQIWNPFYKNCEPLNKVVFVPISGNNVRVMQPIWEKLDIGDYSILEYWNEKYVPTKLVRFWSLVYILPLIRLYFNSTRDEKNLIRTYFEEFFYTMGWFVVLNKLLIHHPIKLLVFSNDHCSCPRVLTKIAKELGIKTLYTQHCSVTERFPPLSFDYSFLDGLESYLKYLQAGFPQGKVYLSGNPRFDIMHQYKNIKINKKKIGIALNHHDDEKEIKSLCMSLLTRGYNQIVIRSHPDEKFDPTWYMEHGIEYSDSNVENPFEFISRMKFIIAGECGIHLDATLMGIQSIYYNMSNEPPLDWYSYIRNGLVFYAGNIDELFNILSSDNSNYQENIRVKAKWYNAAYDTVHEGFIGDMMADFIRCELNNKIDFFDTKYGFKKTFYHDNIIKTLS